MEELSNPISGREVLAGLSYKRASDIQAFPEKFKPNLRWIFHDPAGDFGPAHNSPSFLLRRHYNKIRWERRILLEKGRIRILSENLTFPAVGPEDQALFREIYRGIE
jgi:hypothetical protein